MLLLGENDFATSGHDSFDASSLVMVTLRQATRTGQFVRPGLELRTRCLPECGRVFAGAQREGRPSPPDAHAYQ